MRLRYVLLGTCNLEILVSDFTSSSTYNFMSMSLNVIKMITFHVKVVEIM